MKRNILFLIVLFFAANFSILGQGASAKFTADKTKGCAGLTVNFSDQSTPGEAEIVAWKWTFGDGGTSDEQNPTYTYEYGNNNGYTVSLEVTDANGYKSETNFKIEYINISDKPTVNFFVNANTLCQIPNTANFTSITESPTQHSIESYEWDFGDGTTSDETNPDHSYENNGKYDVSLTVTDENNCSNTKTENDFITVHHITSEFTAPDTICTNEPAELENTSTGEDGVYWSVEDYSISDPSAENQIIQRGYGDPKDFTVTLTTFSNTNSCQQTSTKEIIVDEPQLAFTIDTPWVCSYPTSPVQILDETKSKGPISDWLWTFEDGTTSTDKNPSFSFPNEDTRDVQLEVTTVNGCKAPSPFTKTVKDKHLYVEIKADTTSGCIPLLVNFKVDTLDEEESWFNIENYTWKILNEEKDSVIFEQSSAEDSIVFPIDTFGVIYSRLVIDESTCGLDSTDYWGDDKLIEIRPGDTIHADFFMDETFQYPLNGKDLCAGQKYSFADSTKGGRDKQEFEEEWEWRWYFSNTGAPFKKKDTTLIKKKYTVDPGDKYKVDTVWYDTLNVQYDSINFEDQLYGSKERNKLYEHYTDTIIEDTNGDGCKDTLEYYLDTTVYIAFAISHNNCWDTIIDSINILSPVSVIDSVYRDKNDPYLYHFKGRVVNADTMTWELGDGNVISKSWNNIGNYSLDTTHRYEPTICDTSASPGDCNSNYFKDPIDSIYLVASNKNSGCQHRKLHYYFDAENCNPNKKVVSFHVHGKIKADFYSSHFSSGSKRRDFCWDSNFILSPVTSEYTNIAKFRIIPQANSTDFDSLQPIIDIFRNPDSTTYNLGSKLFNSGQKYPRGIFDVQLITSGYDSIFIEGHGWQVQKDTILKKGYLRIFQPYAKIRVGANERQVCYPTPVNFDSIRDKPIIPDTTYTKWNYDFGDGNNTTLTSGPAHEYTYQDTGWFFPTLVIEDVLGCVNKLGELPDDNPSFPNDSLRRDPGLDEPAGILSTAAYAIFDIIDTSVCQLQDTVELINESYGTQTDLNYEWHFDDGNTYIDSLPQHVYKDYEPPYKQYNVKLIVETQAVNNCLDSLTRPINVYMKPEAKLLTDTREKNCYPAPVEFEDISYSDEEIVQQKWQFGDGQVGFGATPTNFYYDRGNYDVNLEVETKHGCIDDVDSLSYITITGPSAEIYIPDEKVCLYDSVAFILIPDNVDSIYWHFDTEPGDWETDKTPVQQFDVDETSTDSIYFYHQYESSGYHYWWVAYTDPGEGCIINHPVSKEVSPRRHANADFSDPQPDSIYVYPFESKL